MLKFDEADALNQGAEDENPNSPQGLAEYYRGLAHDTHPGPAKAKEREAFLVDELVNMREAHDRCCTFAWELYCAGTEKDMDSFVGTSSEGPVEEVRKHVASLRNHLAAANRAAAS